MDHAFPLFVCMYPMGGIVMESCNTVVKYYKKLLSDFDITMSKDLEDKIVAMYPNTIGIENYVRTIIIKHLEWRD